MSLPSANGEQTFRIELDREEDGRWIADIEAIPGALAYGRSREEAIANVEALALLHSIGWEVKATKGSSHIQLQHATRGQYTWAFHDSEEIGPVMLSKIAKKTGLTPDDL